MEAVKKKFPEFTYAEFKDTYDTFHLYLQIVGKVKLELCSFQNHWWEVAFKINPAGISSGNIPFEREMISIDYLVHTNSFEIRRCDGRTSSIQLENNLSVAAFYNLMMEKLQEVGIDVKINPMPVEIPNPVSFEKDTKHKTIEIEKILKWWEILVGMTMIFEHFRSRFRGKSSPVQFFWGTMDLNYTRYSGKKCEPPKGADIIVRQGDNEENFACGFWAGDETYPNPAVYAYQYPFPKDSADETYDSEVGCFLLPYEKIRKAENPKELVLDFLEDKYQRSAKASGWDLDYFREDFQVKLKTKVTSSGKSEKRENVWSGSGNETLER